MSKELPLDVQFRKAGIYSQKQLDEAEPISCNYLSIITKNIDRITSDTLSEHNATKWHVLSAYKSGIGIGGTAHDDAVAFATNNTLTSSQLSISKLLDCRANYFGISSIGKYCSWGGYGSLSNTQQFIGLRSELSSTLAEACENIKDDLTAEVTQPTKAAYAYAQSGFKNYRPFLEDLTSKILTALVRVERGTLIRVVRKVDALLTTMDSFDSWASMRTSWRGAPSSFLPCICIATKYYDGDVSESNIYDLIVRNVHSYISWVVTVALSEMISNNTIIGITYDEEDTPYLIHGKPIYEYEDGMIRFVGYSSLQPIRLSKLLSGISGDYRLAIDKFKVLIEPKKQYLCKTQREWFDAYKAGPQSCMTKFEFDKSPVRCYAADGNNSDSPLRLFIQYEGELFGEGFKVTHRSIVNIDNNTYVRTYGSNGDAVLELAGYSSDSTACLIGQTLQVIPQQAFECYYDEDGESFRLKADCDTPEDYRDLGRYLMPYTDYNADYVRYDTERDLWVMLAYRGDKYDICSKRASGRADVHRSVFTKDVDDFNGTDTMLPFADLEDGDYYVD